MHGSPSALSGPSPTPPLPSRRAKAETLAGAGLWICGYRWRDPHNPTGPTQKEFSINEKKGARHRPSNSSPMHQPGSGPQVRGTLALILERLWPILALSARQPRDEPCSCRFKPTHQRSINRRTKPAPRPMHRPNSLKTTPTKRRAKKMRAYLDQTDIRG